MLYAKIYWAIMVVPGSEPLVFPEYLSIMPYYH
jgi:hypothetical protein